MKILNLTQHAATADQIAAGVVEPADKVLVRDSLTFNELPCAGDLLHSADRLAKLAQASGHEAAMIGGAPFFMGPLERALAVAGVKVLYAFSVRESVDEKLPDGSVKKTQVFRHAGFVEAVIPASATSSRLARDSYSKHRCSASLARGVLIGGKDENFCHPAILL